MDEDSSPTTPDDLPAPKMLGAWILLLVLLVPAATSTFAAMLGSTSWLGLLAWMSLVASLLICIVIVGRSFFRELSIAIEDSRRGKRPPRLKYRSSIVEPHLPSPFRHRLAIFLQMPEDHVLTPRPRPVSSMPFWSSVPLSPRPIVMKSVEFIRAVLERIHAAVRG